MRKAIAKTIIIKVKLTNTVKNRFGPFAGVTFLFLAEGTVFI